MDMLAQNYTRLTELVVEQRREMAELRELSATAHKRLDNQEQQLAELKQQTAEIKREGHRPAASG